MVFSGISIDLGFLEFLSNQYRIYPLSFYLREFLYCDIGLNAKELVIGINKLSAGTFPSLRTPVIIDKKSAFIFFQETDHSGETKTLVLLVEFDGFFFIEIKKNGF
jgi:hypothetical protein